MEDAETSVFLSLSSIICADKLFNDFDTLILNLFLLTSFSFFLFLSFLFIFCVNFFHYFFFPSFRKTNCPLSFIPFAL